MARPAKISRIQLYEEAAKAFALRGYAGASIQELADALGVKKSAIYHYCRSKEELLFDISRDAMERSLERLENAVAPGGSAEEAIRRMVRAHVSALAETHYEHRTMMTELDSLSPERRQEVKLLRDRYEAMWSEVIERGIAEGTFSNAETKFVRLGALGALNWMIYWYRPEERSIDEIADGLANFILRGLGAAAVPTLDSRRRRSAARRANERTTGARARPAAGG